jgi:hypothetical protein
MSAAFTDPGRGRDLTGSQADAGGALAGDQRPHPGTAVTRPPAAVADGRAVVGSGQPRPGNRCRGASPPPLRSSAVWVRWVRGRPVRATLISSSNARQSTRLAGLASGWRALERRRLSA